MNSPRRPYNNPGIHTAGQDANARRSRAAAERQAQQARRALAVLTERGDLYDHWAAVLQQRVNNPTASLRDLAAAMTPPMTKDAFAAQLRRALTAAGVQ